MKIFLIFLFILLFNTSLVARTSIKFFVPSGATAEVSRLYSNFMKQLMKQDKYIHIQFIPKNSYDSVLKEVLFLNEKKQPWVAIVEISELMTLKDKNAILPLDDLIAKSKFKNDKPFLDQFIQGFLGNSYGDDGKIYGLPIFRSTPIVYYNLDMIEKFGVDIKQLPKTWKEFKTFLQKIRKKSNKPPLGLASTWYGWLFEAFVLQNNGSLANTTNTKLLLDSEPVIGALEFWKDLYKNKLLERSKGSWKSTIHNFVLGYYPCIYYSTGGMSYAKSKAKFKWTTTIMPGNPNFGTTVGGGNIFISSHVDEKEKLKAWKIVKFLLLPWIQSQLSGQTGYFPVVPDAFAQPEIRRKYSEDKRFIAARKQLEYSKSKIMTRNFLLVRRILKDAIDKVLDKNVPVRKALSEAQIEGQKAIK